MNRFEKVFAGLPVEVPIKENTTLKEITNVYREISEHFGRMAELHKPDPKPEKDIDLELELKTHFGYDEFRDGQREIIEHLVNERNVLASCPTAFGKSICYQLPALILPGLTLVVSPLISLMKDQVDNLVEKGITSGGFINSTQTTDERKHEMKRLENRQTKILYVSPEKLASRWFVELLKQQDIALVIIDEAHCVSQWGHDFRPDYLKIYNLISRLMPKAVGMFTATATEEVKKDIIDNITPYDDNISINHNVERKNLKNIVVRVENNSQKYEGLIEAIENIEGDGIIYAGTRKKVEEVAEYLINHNINADYYHAGRTERERKDVQESFFTESGISVIVATNAFGMGIDKADIRYVIHWDMPGTLENYTQESGRAGRDGKDSICILLYNEGDESLHNWFTKQSTPKLNSLIHTYEYIKNHKGIGEYKIIDKTVLADEVDVSEDKTNVLLSNLEKYGIIQWHNNLPAIINIEVKSRKPDKVLDILKTKDTFSIYELCEILDENPNEAYSTLSNMQKYNELKFWGKEDGTLVKVKNIKDIKERLQLHIEMEQCETKKNQKTETQLEYIRTDECRTKVVQQYFGETHTDNCGNCDNCNKHLQAIDSELLFGSLWLWAIDDDMKKQPKSVKEEILEETYISEELCMNEEFDI